MALADLIRKPDKVTVEQVITAVCSYYNVTNEALCGTSRSRTVSLPRQIAMYLARTETEASLPQIGTHMGNRDHTTILYGVDKIASLMETDAITRRELLEIKANLYDS